jgi:hypothetical protein
VTLQATTWVFGTLIADFNGGSSFRRGWSRPIRDDAGNDTITGGSGADGRYGIET